MGSARSCWSYSNKDNKFFKLILRDKIAKLEAFLIGGFFFIIPICTSAQQSNNTPYLFKSTLDKTTNVGYDNSDLKNLGMEGNPSEFGIYLSLIKSNNLHIKKGDEYVISIEFWTHTYQGI